MMAAVDESGETPYGCEDCGHVAAFPVVAFTPIGHARCTDRHACEKRQATKTLHREQPSHA